jgi:hypothetical protein
VLTRRRLIARSAGSALALSLSGRAAWAQTQSLDWPNRVVRFIVPFAAGGPTDIVARVVTEQLSKIWGQQVVIENRGAPAPISTMKWSPGPIPMATRRCLPPHPSRSTAVFTAHSATNRLRILRQSPSFPVYSSEGHRLFVTGGRPPKLARVLPSLPPA